MAMLPKIAKLSQRSYVTRATRLPDPLKTSQKHVLSNGAEFFIRPLPTATPLDIDFVQPNTAKEPVQTVEDFSHPLAVPRNASPQHIRPNAYELRAPLLHRRRTMTATPTSDLDVQNIREDRQSGLSQTELSRKHNISRAQAAKLSFSDKQARKDLNHERQAALDLQRSTWGWNKWLNWETRRGRRAQW